MRKILLTIILATIQISLFSQVCLQAVWAKSFGGNSQYNGIVDGGRRTDALFTICGSFGAANLTLDDDTLNAVGNYHYFLGTHDTSGTFNNTTIAAWYSLSTDILVIRKIHIGVDNSVYITGYWRGITVHIGDSLLPVASRNRMFVARFDSNLQHVWTKVSDKTSADCQANSVTSDAQKNVYVGGSFEDNIFKMGTFVAKNFGGWNMWRDDAFLLKLDSLGNPQYVKNIGTPSDDAIFAMVTDQNNDLYIFGHAGSSTSIFKFDDQIAVPGGVAGSSLFYGKYSGVDGHCVWGKLGGSHYSSGYLYVSDITMQENSAIIICGTIVGQANLYPYTYSTYDQNGYVAKFLLNGDNVWLKTIGGQNSSESASRVSYYNGQIAVVGSLYSNQPYMGTFPMYSTLSGGSHRAYNGMLDTLGNTLWARTNKLVSSGSDHYYNGCALIDNDGNQIIWGNFKGSQTWYPATINNSLSNSKLFGVRFAPYNGNPAFTVSAGPDKIATCGTSIQLNGAITPSTNVAYGWAPDLGFSSNGSKTPYVNPGTPTTYILYATYQGCVKSDTVNVTYPNHDLTLSVPDSYSFCVGDSVQIMTTCNQPTATFSWAPSVYINSATSQNPYVKPALTTQYVVTATNGGCVAIDTVTIFARLKPYVALPKQDMYNMWRTHLCDGDTIPITFGDPLNTYSTTTPNLLLNMNNNTAQLLPINGILKIQAVNSFGCTASDSVNVVVHNNQSAPPVQGTVIDRIKCPGDTAYFNIQFNSSIAYTFQYSWYAGWQVDSLDGAGWRDIHPYDSDFEITNYSVGYPTSVYYSKLKLNYINQNMNGFKYRPYVHDYCSPRGYGNHGLIVVGAPITAQPNDITLCQGATDSISVNTSETSALFNWEILQNGSFVPLVEQPGVLELNGRFLRIVNANTTIDSTVVRCKIIGCSGISEVFTQPALIRVIQGAQILSQPIGDTLCNESITSLQVVVDSPNLYTFRWYQNDIMLVNNTTHLTGVNTPTLQFIPISTQQSGVQYKCEILNAQCNVGIYTTPASFLVNPLPTVSWDTATYHICENSSPITLSGAYPIGGIYSGLPVVNGVFPPAGLAPYTYDIFYTYTEVATGCSNSVFRLFKVDSVPIVHLSGLNDFYCVYHPSSTLIGTPEGGVFSGNGVTGNQFSPALSGIGNWPIVYTFSDNNQCIATDTVWVDVEGCDAVTDYVQDGIEIFPNPSTGIFHLKIEVPTEVTIEVFSVLGQKLTTFQFNKEGTISFNLSHLDRGVYLIKMSQNGKSQYAKVILQ